MVMPMRPAKRKAEHWERTVEIVRLEPVLNERDYGLFGLTASKIAMVEESTKYRCGRCSCGLRAS